ncbi:MAG: BlaI/MecI/CopY family transcriptional regulator [Bacteroidales bacterium]|nr:BlaI/MecI/CopY family transcriptional regulator [Bacteroidales bacterium]
MKELTKAEEQIMQILWKMKKGFVKEIVEFFPEPKPAYNTVSTIVRILEEKEFIGHEPFGRTHQYFPLITKKEYAKKFMKGFMKNYFENSAKKMFSFLSDEDELTVSEIEELKKEMDKIIEKRKK